MKQRSIPRKEKVVSFFPFVYTEYVLLLFLSNKRRPYWKIYWKIFIGNVLKCEKERVSMSSESSKYVEVMKMSRFHLKYGLWKLNKKKNIDFQ